MSKETLGSVEKGLGLLRMGTTDSGMSMDDEIKARNV